MTRDEIIDKLIATYEAKNADYGNSVHKTFVVFGEAAPVIRISDKLSRLESLYAGEQNVKDESVLDTLGDAVTYLCMLAAEIDCDDPCLTEQEKMKTDGNIAQTKFWLNQLREENAHTVIPREHWRDTLIAIWRGIVDPDIRVEEYINLAEELLEEYKIKSEESS